MLTNLLLCVFGSDAPQSSASSSQVSWIQNQLNTMSQDTSNPMMAQLKQAVTAYLGRGLPIPQQVYRAGRTDPTGALQGAQQSIDGYVAQLKQFKYEEQEALSILIKYCVEGETENVVVDEETQVAQIAQRDAAELSVLQQQLSEWGFENTDLPTVLRSSASGMLAEKVEELCDLALCDDEKSLNLLIAIAQQNYPLAQYNLATVYEQRKDVEQTLYWYMQAAKNGHVDAMYQVALVYEKQSHWKEAIGWLEKAANKNHRDAQYELGAFYQKGIQDVLKQDLEKTKTWYLKAANQDHTDAQRELGKIYFTEGEKSTSELSLQKQTDGLALLKKAGNKSDPQAQYWLGFLYETKNMIRCISLNNYERVPFNLPEALSWYEKSAKLNYPIAQFRLDDFYETGESKERNGQIASQWSKKSAEQNRVDIQYWLGRMYEEGRGVEKQDDTKAFSYYLQAAEKKHPDALAYLGIMYEEGRGIEKNEALAVDLYQKSNTGLSLLRLGHMYERGVVVDRNVNMARQCYKQCYEKNDRDSQFHFACFMENGLSQYLNYNKDEMLLAYKKAADQNHGQAAYNLANLLENMSKSFDYAGNLVNKKCESTCNEYLKIAAEQCIADGRYRYGMKQGQSGIPYLKKAADQGHAGAQYELGCICEEGKHNIAKNEATAAEFFKRAAASGHTDAQLRLAKMYEEGRGVEKNEAIAKRCYRKAGVEK